MAAKPILWRRLLWPWGSDTSMFLCLLTRAWLGFLRQWRWCCFLLLGLHLNQHGGSLLINRASLLVLFSLACSSEPIRGALFRINTDGGGNIFHLFHQYEFLCFYWKERYMIWENFCVLSYLSPNDSYVIKAKCFFLVLSGFWFSCLVNIIVLLLYYTCFLFINCNYQLIYWFLGNKFEFELLVLLSLVWKYLVEWVSIASGHQISSNA